MEKYLVEQEKRYLANNASKMKVNYSVKIIGTNIVKYELYKSVVDSVGKTVSCNDYKPADSDEFAVEQGSGMILGYVRGVGMVYGLEEMKLVEVVEKVEELGLEKNKKKVSNEILGL